MKSYTVVALISLAICALTAAGKHIESRVADKDFLVKQKFVLDVLQHIYQDDVFVTKFGPTYVNYKPWEHLDDFNQVDQVKQFVELWQHKPMHDDEVFSVVNDRHVEYYAGLTHTIYNAKDWNTYTHVVYWARVHVNKQLFVHAFHVATLFRKDLQGVVLPAIYEVLPWHFFDVDALEAAQHYKEHGFHNVKKLDNVFNVVIKTNYSNVYGNVNDDHSLAYFTEDIGLNSFYYYYNIDYAAWAHGPTNQELKKDRRGELYLFIHTQFLARYYLERLSNDLGEIPAFNVYNAYQTGHHSNLNYYRGVNFPDRVNNHHFYHEHNYEHAKEIEILTQRIAEFVDTTTDDYGDAVEKLGNILQGNVNSINKRFYGSLEQVYRQVVNEAHPYGKYGEVLPSDVSHHETVVRDPIFYSVVKELLYYYWRLAENYPEYMPQDLHFPGVKIENVRMPEGLTTFFEYFDADISNVVNVEPPVDGAGDNLVKFGRNSHHNGQSFVIKARQVRLNHKPFEFTIDVTSDKSQKAVVKVFVGPKYDENGKVLHLTDNYQNFFELDHFVVDLNAGINHVKRNSVEFGWYVDDRTTYLELYHKVMDATNTDYKFPLNQAEAHCGLPQRLMLPKGKKGGLPVQFFYIVYPYHAPEVPQYSTFDPVVSCGVGSGSRHTDSLPFGFPFNRPVKHEYYFQVPNVKFHEVKIYHKDDTANVV